MPDGDITCPKCGAEIPLTEAVSHRLREELSADFEKQRSELNLALKRREDQLKADKDALKERLQAVEQEVSGQIEKERQKLVESAAREAQESLGAQLKQLQSELDQRNEKLKLAREAELDLRRKQRELEEAKASMELEIARKLDSERQKIADAARRQAAEAEQLRLTEKEKVISDLQREIRNLKQRAEQGSMQLQGESLELTLETDLRQMFPFDLIEEVKKGERGADVVQRVRTNAGLACGVILWEAKRAKNWANQWPAKLKEDQRTAGAELAVLVTTSLPEELRGIGQVEGIWVCEPLFAGPLACALRQGLISTAAQRMQDTDRSSKMALLYDHLCGVEFRQHIQALVESFVGLQDQLASEQRALAKQWKEREKQIQRAIRHTAELYGGVQGIAGREALPEIASLQLHE